MVRDAVRREERSCASRLSQKLSQSHNWMSQRSIRLCDGGRPERGRLTVRIVEVDSNAFSKQGNDCESVAPATKRSESGLSVGVSLLEARQVCLRHGHLRLYCTAREVLFERSFQSIGRRSAIEGGFGVFVRHHY